MAGIQTVKYPDANREGDDHNDLRRCFLVPEKRHAGKENSHRNNERDISDNCLHSTDQAH
jgi:hypothetical protein